MFDLLAATLLLAAAPGGNAQATAEAPTICPKGKVWEEVDPETAKTEEIVIKDGVDGVCVKRAAAAAIPVDEATVAIGAMQVGIVAAVVNQATSDQPASN
ncbi:hypothetical protein [Sphingomicrobium aestuariivivum]|uniref:hypothetical protein n=1 Tax=Sphingomicrobium aestuariivivum TaxID=1582356 RepID=UPI001FD6C3D0|nr:hypothetical protein [Sphingomicrobium aestuariivivum]MCJ8191535.1 hypothetical protein [Sphingomicrobium aestuariivivum]